MVSAIFVANVPTPQVMKRFLNHMAQRWTRPNRRLAAIAFLFLLPGGLGWVPSSQAQTADEGIEILTRGPVHEAFAATSSFKAIPGIMVSNAPPTVVDEIPPDQRPVGANVTWIPGYWSWDEETTGFIWVSGIWRNLPPGRQWIPGYWFESEQEFQWIPGYWADSSVEEVEYLDAPPASLEAGPNIQAPTNNHSWVPGNWRWLNSRYSWQGGYWDEARPDWMWVPPYYSSTPRGYIYVDGYYDYDVARRGVIFAPVRFYGNNYGRPEYRYRPSTVISLSALVDHLFLRPRSRHYYFGDYYAPEYRRSGYYSSYNYYSGGHGYDPIYAHERWTHRDEEGWERRSEENYNFYRDNRDERPPHTLAAFTSFLSRPDRNRRVEPGFASRLDQFASRQDSKLKFKPVEQGERENFVRSGRELREYGEARRKSLVRTDEITDSDRPAKAKEGKDQSRKGESKKIKTPKSPVVARGEGRESGDTPPERGQASRSDGSSGGRAEPGARPGNEPGGNDNNKEAGRKDSQDPREIMPRESKGNPERPSRQDRKGDTKRDANPDQRVDKRPERKQDGREALKPDAKQEKQTEQDRGPKAEPKRDSKPDAKGEPKEERKREPQEEPKTEPQRESKQAPRTEPKREPQQDKKAESKRESKQDPKGETKTEPRRESPRQEPNGEPKREPKAEPRREERKQKPQAEPKREPKPEARRPQPQDPKRQPKAESRQQPKPPSQEPAPAKKNPSKPAGEKDKEKKGKG